MFLCMAIAGGRLVMSGAKIDAAAEDAEPVEFGLALATMCAH